MPMDYYIWVARSDTRTVVIDTGFNAETGKQRGRDFLRCPTAGLALLGIEASMVADVILTHLHYDHAGNYDRFPNAMFHVQDRELAYATGRYMRHRILRETYDVESVVGLVRQLYAGRVACCEDGEQIAPGITVHHLGGHTAGLQVARIETPHGPVVLASDAFHFYANFEQARPFPIVFHVGDMLDGYERLRHLVPDANRIIPGHDPQVMQRYRAPTPACKDVVVQIDRDPQ
jgi:glyoxylase-like metal-dependent hydrolase (beta-lactamase superfamily II)